MKVILLNTKELPCPGTHRFHTIKFLSSFTEHGFNFYEVNDISKFIELSPEKDDIVYVSDHGLGHKDQELNSTFNQLNFISQFDCTFILWFYHNLINKPEFPKFKKWILTGEHFRKKPKKESHIKCWEIQSQVQNYVPLTFASSVKPELIGTFKRNEVLKASFVGHSYQQNWCYRLSHDAEKISIIYTPPFISEINRVNMFLTSVTSLGFHSQSNIDNSVIVERVFEGLSFGNIVISDNPACEEATDGIVKYISSYEELLSQINFWWKNKDIRNQKQIDGMKWCKDHGTYKNVSESFLELIKKLY